MSRHRKPLMSRKIITGIAGTTRDGYAGYRDDAPAPDSRLSQESRRRSQDHAQTKRRRFASLPGG